QHGDCGRRKALTEPRLHHTRLGSFGHNDQRAGWKGKMLAALVGGLHKSKDRMYQALRRPRCSGPSTLKIIAHDPAQDEPCCAYRAFHRAADFGFSNAWIVTHRDFNNTKSCDGALHDHFDGPAIGGLFERQCVKHISASGAERTEIADLYAV